MLYADVAPEIFLSYALHASQFFHHTKNNLEFTTYSVYSTAVAFCFYGEHTSFVGRLIDMRKLPQLDYKYWH